MKGKESAYMKGLTMKNIAENPQIVKGFSEKGL